MKPAIFISYCSVIVAFFLSLHVFFEDSLSPVDRLKEQLALVEKQRQEANFRALLLADQLAEYRQHVATLIPDVMKGMKEHEAYPLRQLASVSSGGGDVIRIERASGIFEKAKAAFRDKDFEKSNQLLASMIARYPDSVHVAEAHFLLAEGQYQLKDFSAATSTIEKMVDLFPENELTGFALLRLGHIYELQDRVEDAGDIYKAVLENFKQPELVKQARTSLKAVAL